MKNKFWVFLVIFVLLLCGCNNSPADVEKSSAVDDTPVSFYESEREEIQTADSDLSLIAENTATEIPKQLTESEYGKLLAEYWQEYSDSAKMIDELEEQSDNDFYKLKEVNGEMMRIHDNIKAVLDKFFTLIPPEEYQELHQKLLLGADMEKRWLDLQKEVYSADTEEEANEKYDDILEEINSVPVDDLFPSVYVKIRLKLQGIQ